MMVPLMVDCLVAKMVDYLVVSRVLMMVGL